MQDGEDALSRFLDAIDQAREARKLAAILWKLPPSFASDLHRLAAFCHRLPPPVRHAFEFRHETWQSPDVLRFFRQAELPLAFVDAGGPSVGPGEPPAGSFVYVRRHGAEGLGRGLYGRERLRPLAASLARLLPLPPRA